MKLNKAGVYKWLVDDTFGVPQCEQPHNLTSYYGVMDTIQDDDPIKSDDFISMGSIHNPLSYLCLCKECCTKMLTQRLDEKSYEEPYILSQSDIGTSISETIRFLIKQDNKHKQYSDVVMDFTPVININKSILPIPFTILFAVDEWLSIPLYTKVDSRFAKYDIYDDYCIHQFVKFFRESPEHPFTNAIKDADVEYYNKLLEHAKQWD